MYMIRDYMEYYGLYGKSLIILKIVISTWAFSGSYLTMLTKSCGKFEEIAARSRLKGSQGLGIIYTMVSVLYSICSIFCALCSMFCVVYVLPYAFYVLCSVLCVCYVLLHPTFYFLYCVSVVYICLSSTPY